MERRKSLGGKSEIITQKIGIRADANDIIATGHIMRCITIARQLISLGCEVIFYTADEYGGKLLAQADMPYVCLHTEWNHMETETEALCEELVKANCQKLLVDSYYVTEKYFQSLANLCKLIYIDDCFENIYPVDMLINYNAYHIRFPYKETYTGRTQLLLGTQYVPLREEFGDAGCVNDVLHNDNGVQTASDTHILLSSGGGDPCNALSGIIETVTQDETFKNVTFDVVVGMFNRNAEELKRLANMHSNICLHEYVEHMAQLMRGCTVAVSAAGTTLFELCATRTPTVFFASADNQQYDHEIFSKEEIMLYAGDIRANRVQCLHDISSSLKRLLRDEALRDKMRQRLYEVTDGRGAHRIAEEIIRLH